MEVVQAFGLQKGQEVEVAVHPQTGAITIRPGVAYVDGGQCHGPFPGAGRRGPHTSRGAAHGGCCDDALSLGRTGPEPASGPDGSAQRRPRHPRSPRARRGSRSSRRLVFDGDDLYPTLAAKAAALLHAIVTTTPFVTASKGTAAVAAECFLAANGFALAATDQELADMTTSIEKGEMGIEAASDLGAATGPQGLEVLAEAHRRSFDGRRSREGSRTASDLLIF